VTTCAIVTPTNTHGTAAPYGVAPASEEGLVDLPVPVGYTRVTGVPDAAANVADGYVQFLSDLNDGTTISPDFGHALQRHRLLELIRQAASTGQRQIVTSTV
jgi:predicted dehydrogenase